MKIRRINIKNYDKIVPLFNQYRMFYNKTSDLVSADYFLHERLSRGESVIFAASLIDSIDGFALLYPSFSSVNLCKNWILNDLYVIEKARKKGIAQALIDKVLEFADSDDARNIILETKPDNHAAQQLYLKKGFIKQNKKSDYEVLIRMI